MSDQRKPKIDLKARLGKKTVTGPTGGPPIPPPVGIPKPPVMGGMGGSPSQPPPARVDPSNPYAAVEAHHAPPRVAAQRAIQVEMSAEVVEGQRKAQRRSTYVGLIASLFVGFIGFTWGGSHERGKGANAALEGAKDLIKDIQEADKTADQLNEVLSKASERLGKNEYPAEEVTKLGEINIPFDGGHLTDKGLGRFKKDVATMLINYANQAQKANDQKEKIQNLLSGTKGGIQDILAQKNDPKIHWGVIVSGTPNGPWASMQQLPTAFLMKSDKKVKDKDGKEKDYEWPADITLGSGKDAETLKRYKSGDPSSGDPPPFIPVNPQTESMVCPSTTIVRLRQELSEMQTVLKGDATTPGQEKPGFLQLGEQVMEALKKIGQS
jgi:hypothetical protein